MTDALTRTLHDRAERAADPDHLSMLAEVHGQVVRRTHRRRVLVGSGAGFGVAAAIVVTTLVVANSVGGGAHQSAAGAAPTTSPSQTVTPAPVTSTKARPSPHPRLVSPPIGASLVNIAAAPKEAPLSLGLVPNGWRYIGELSSVTAYGPRNAPRGNKQAGSYVGKIVAEVVDRRPGEKFPTTIAGHPAFVQLAQSPALWIVDIAFNAKILLTIQVWPNARLSRAQVVRMANTLIVRDVSSPARG